MSLNSTALNPTAQSKGFWHTHGGMLLMLMPLLAFLFVFYAIPFGNLVGQSLTYSSADEGAHGGLTFYQYIKTYESGRIVRAIVRTFRISIVTVIITLLASYPLALFLLRSGRVVRTTILLVTFVSLASSLIVRNYGWVVVLADGGAINSLLMALGMIDRPVRLIFSESAIVLGLVHFSIPFMVLPIYGSLLRLPVSFREASLSLGGTEWRTFRTIILPLSLPGVFGGTMLAFAVSMSAYVTPLMLGSPSTAMISQVAADQMLIHLNFPLGSAIIVMLTVLTFALVACYSLVLRKVFRAEI
ncbi:ABC transporter permease [Castellaniella sp. GW247-6E4]|uniref:ABC transporter permease n=1 Tax=Castellaniella sp. GW247-6E4 TaxID=3140380 RepID=UPI003314F6A9